MAKARLIFSPLLVSCKETFETESCQRILISEIPQSVPSFSEANLPTQTLGMSFVIGLGLCAIRYANFAPTEGTG